MGSRYDSGSRAIQEGIVDFAYQKLIGTPRKLPSDGSSGMLAAMSTRIPLQFSATNSDAARLEEILVEKHLRVCLAIQPGTTAATTVSASEPLLAEAARRVTTKINMASELLDTSRLSRMDKGDRGEVVGMLLVTLAYDAARSRQEASGGARGEGVLPQPRPAISLLDFLDHLFGCYSVADGLPTHVREPKDKTKARHIEGHTSRSSDDGGNSDEGADETWSDDEELSNVDQPTENVKLGDLFKNAKVYFNHFTQVHSKAVLNQLYLPGFMRRGATILCASGQTGVDLCVPFVFDGDSPKIKHSNTGLILIQVKNDNRYGGAPNLELFDQMDPHKLGIYHQKRIPVVRIVFVLAAPPSSAGVTLLGRSQETSTFTSFDFWCAGITRKTFAPIKDKQNERKYEELLHMSQRILDAIKPKGQRLPKEEEDRMETRRSMLPCATEEPAHWRLFYDDLSSYSEMDESYKRDSEDSVGDRASDQSVKRVKHGR